MLLVPDCYYPSSEMSHQDFNHTMEELECGLILLSELQSHHGGAGVWSHTSISTSIIPWRSWSVVSYFYQDFNHTMEVLECCLILLSGLHSYHGEAGVLSHTSIRTSFIPWRCWGVDSYFYQDFIHTMGVLECGPILLSGF